MRYEVVDCVSVDQGAGQLGLKRRLEEMQLDELPVRGRNRQLPTTLARADARVIIQRTPMLVKSEAQ